MWLRVPFVLAVVIPLVVLRSPRPGFLEVLLIAVVAFGGARLVELGGRRAPRHAIAINLGAAAVALLLALLVRARLERPAPPAPRLVERPEEPREPPPEPNEILPGAWRALSVGESEGAAIGDDGRVYVWDARPPNHAAPPPRTPQPIGGTEGAETVSVGFGHGCALRGGQALCWGWNYVGEVGRPSTGTHDHRDPAVVAELPAGVRLTAVSAGAMHTCAIDDAGAVWCWGGNEHGECGAPPARAQPAARVAGLPVPATALRAGFHATCALGADLRVYCWGDRELLGNGYRPEVFSPEPAAVPGVAGALDFDLSERGACALMPGGVIACWGRALAGERTTIAGAVDVAVGGSHRCAARRDGTVLCWGKNWYGQLGDGTRRESASPVPVRDVSGILALSAGGNDTCGLDAEARIVCWGRFDKGPHQR